MPARTAAAAAIGSMGLVGALIARKSDLIATLSLIVVAPRVAQFRLGPAPTRRPNRNVIASAASIRIDHDRVNAHA